MKRSTSPPPSDLPLHRQAAKPSGRSAAGPVSVRKAIASPPPAASCPPLSAPGPVLVEEPPASPPPRSTAPSLVKPPATPPKRDPARREPSPSPEPPITWLLLDRCVHRSNRKSGVLADDPTTSDIAYDCAGRQIRVSLRVADPPLVSRLYLHWTHRPVTLQMNLPYVIAAHRHSILFKVYVPFEDPCWWYNYMSFPIDYFVYSAASPSTSSSQKSLTRLPPVFDNNPGPFGDPRADELLKPYPRQKQRFMWEADIAFFCHGDDGDFTVAHLDCLSSFQHRLLELCTIHHSPSQAVVSPMQQMQWRVQKLPAPKGMEMIYPFSYWMADTTFSVDGCLCWVDYYHGMLLVDLRLANSDSEISSEDQQLQLLRYIPLPQLALESSRLYMDSSAPDPFRHVCVIDEDAGIVKLVCIFTQRSQPTFTISTWTLDIHQGSSWNEDPSTVITDSTFFRMFDAAHSNLPRVEPRFPVVSLADPDVICFLLEDHDEHEDTYWGIEINMREKVLQSTALYITEEEEEERSLEKKPPRWKFIGQHFVTSRFTSYLREAKFKSRQKSKEMEVKARQRLGMRKKAGLENLMMKNEALETTYPGLGWERSNQMEADARQLLKMQEEDAILEEMEHYTSPSLVKPLATPPQSEPARSETYLGEVELKSREISIQMEKEARQRLAKMEESAHSVTSYNIFKKKSCNAKGGQP